MLNNQTPSVPAQKVSYYELSDYRVKLYSKRLVQTNYLSIKTRRIMECGIIGYRITSIHCI